ncbi:MAG TPA: FAD-binding oxidoreductase [Actinomycetota bacterium]|nr:FAD-binding oxidoreductase [Actinomycetota bacterium]
MSDPSYTEASFTQFSKSFSGRIVRPGDAVYEDARAIFNAMVEKRPSIIATCTNEDDVVLGIEFAREHGLEIAVRSGGHSVAGAGLSDGGIVLDMRGMNRVQVDATNRVVRAGGGAVWGELDKATAMHGLATTGGRVSTTGVAGLTLGGGSGWLERKHGLACDNLLAVELITAEGERVRASQDENPDLFWALHGGGGNFGVATAFEFRVHPIGENILAALLLYPPERGPEVARVYRDLVANAPDELGGGFAYLTAPPEEFVAPQLQGTVMSGVIVTWAGDVAAGEKFIQPLLNLDPAVQLVMPVPYVEFQHMLDDPPGYRNYWTAEYHQEFPDEAIDIFCDFGMRAKPSPTQLILLPWGGQVGRVGEDDTPMTQRGARWVTHPLSLWESAADDDFWITWSRAVADEMKRFSTGATYLNFIGDEGADRVVSAFGQKKYERLAAIKAQYDPDNVFHLNQNIKPLAGAR